MFPSVQPAFWFEIAGSYPLDWDDYVYELHVTDCGTVSFTYHVSTQFGDESGLVPALYGPAPATFAADSGASLAELPIPR